MTHAKALKNKMVKLGQLAIPVEEKALRKIHYFIRKPCVILARVMVHWLDIPAVHAMAKVLLQNRLRKHLKCHNTLIMMRPYSLNMKAMNLLITKREMMGIYKS